MSKQDEIDYFYNLGREHAQAGIDCPPSELPRLIPFHYETTFEEADEAYYEGQASV